MSAASVTVRYDGPILSNHQMDVADLAPALLGISELCKIANRKFNGERAAVKVLIGTDVEHQCFQIDLNVVQTLWEHTKSLIKTEDVKSAKEVLEWLGLLGIPTGGILGLFALLKKLSNRRITEAALESKDGRDFVRITIEGDNNTVLVFPQTFDLLKDDTVINNAKRVVQPISQDGYDSLEFKTDSKVTERINKPEAISIAGISTSTALPSALDPPQLITAWVNVYAPVYDINAPKWRFKFGDSHQYMDISETEIAALTLVRGGAMIDDSYRVILELTQEHNANGSIINHYKIKKVLDFRPARLPYQLDAFKSTALTKPPGTSLIRKD